ncbi:MAG: Crp/Fnr family transcriptional regulator [Betaproteobacteria bacterium]
MNPLHNSIFAALPVNDLAELLPHLQLISLAQDQVLFEMGEIPAHVHFPVGAIVSMINDLPNGETIELHMLGKTCMVGVAAIDTPSFYRASVRVAGLAYRVPLEVLKALRRRSPDYFVQAQTRTALLMNHIAQRATCIKYHQIEQQVVRWLLLMLDRQYDTVIKVTHCELAKLIGARREAITLVSP